MLYDVFLSYSSSDRDSAARLTGALERAGLSVWSDIKLAKDIPFDKQIKDALVDSAALVALISRYALKSKWVRCGKSKVSGTNGTAAFMLRVYVDSDNQSTNMTVLEARHSK